ncbi:MAG: 23S rRNA (adenine(2503)-C(2))-methyltransferase RlmN [Fretibacterium sp.]|nr:23S rRNA (adenine(2503)-C(2))-methyltransferase RlmN [Fretibacterium sp.]
MAETGLSNQGEQEFGACEALSLSYEDWQEKVRAWNEPRFRADQITRWIYVQKVFDCHEMSNLSKGLREKISYELLMTLPILIQEQKSKDGTFKYLWQMADGQRVESVILNHGGYTTACLSSQVGCPLACSFCATGGMGFVRNLTSAEILGQFLMMERRAVELLTGKGNGINNVVFMGMGEPFLNMDDVFASIRTLQHPKMRALGARHITISTSGVIPGILALADFELPVRLSVSLHAPNDVLRSKLMPVNKTYSLSSLIEALRHYKEKTKERVTFEYVLIEGVNDDPQLAYEMAALLDGLEPYVNLIRYNPVPGKEAYKRSSETRVKAFCAALKELRIEFEVRQEKGTDIMAACGQLAVSANRK